MKITIVEAERDEDAPTTGDYAVWCLYLGKTAWASYEFRDNVSFKTVVNLSHHLKLYDAIPLVIDKKSLRVGYYVENQLDGLRFPSYFKWADANSDMSQWSYYLKLKHCTGDIKISEDWYDDILAMVAKCNMLKEQADNAGIDYNNPPY